MSFFRKLAEFFTPSGPQKAPDFSSYITVKCSRCGELIQARIDLRNDLTVDYDNADGGYYCRKVLIGEKRCYQPIEVQLNFDRKRKIIQRQVSGGEFIEQSQ
jgi:hypothetical protein